MKFKQLFSLKNNNRVRRLLFLIPFSLFLCTAAHALDESIDCAGRPRWDRFVIDENSDKWDPDSARCYDMPPVDSAKLYGSPKMYGELENINYETAPQAKPAPKVKAKPVIKTVIPAPKPKAKPKPKPKPVVKAVVPVPEISAKSPGFDGTVRAEAKPKQVEPVLPDSKATAIAGALKDGWIDMESFCTSVNPPVKGKMPAGIVLMPGRPDLMCCVTRN